LGVRSSGSSIATTSWINGVKTGHTLDAGYVLVGSGTRDGMTLISAVLGTSTQSARDSNTLALMNYGFANFHRVNLVTAGSVLARPTVRDQPGQRAAVIASRTFTDVVPRSAQVTVRIEVPRQLAGPLPRHAVVGMAVVLLDGRTLTRIPILLARRLPAVSPLTLAARFITRPFTLVVLVLLLCAAVGLTVRRRTRTRRADVVGPEPA
jgi:D-alanyl-D-alanine carboxypeptidase (penicillin-binding protein 5/6)